jgi:hypothetical protein
MTILAVYILRGFRFNPPQMTTSIQLNSTMDELDTDHFSVRYLKFKPTLRPIPKPTYRSRDADILPAAPSHWARTRAKEKVPYKTLAEALTARSSLTRKRGARFRHLRPYKIHGVWFLTKMSKGQVRHFAAALR